MVLFVVFDNVDVDVVVVVEEVGYIFDSGII